MQRLTFRQRLSVVLTAVWLVGAVSFGTIKKGLEADALADAVFASCRDSLGYTEATFRTCSAEMHEMVRGHSYLADFLRSVVGASLLAAMFWGLFALVWFTTRWVSRGERAPQT